MITQSIRRTTILVGLMALFALDAAAYAGNPSSQRIPTPLAEQYLKGHEAGPLGRAMGPDETEEDTRIPGRYIVVFKNSVKGPATVARNQVEQRGGEVGLVYRHALKGYSAELSKGAVQALRNDPRVRYVQPDYKVEALAQTTPTGVERIFATENTSIDIDEEDDVRVDADVAVIDTGVDHEHPDLNVVGRVNCVPAGEKPNEEPEGCVPGAGTDGRGHGTHVAGTIAALDNGEGVVGVAPGARISAVRVLNKAGSGAMSWVVAGVDWVTATREDESSANDIDVANMSLGCPCSFKALDDAISGYEEGEEHVPGSVDLGVVYVVAAGNSAVNAAGPTPASNPDVITVSALADTDGAPGGSGPEECIDDAPDPDVTRTYTDDALAPFSNWGATVDIAAPGGCILSTYPGGEYKTSSGTSMASPHVAGAAAILASESSPDSKEDVEAIREDLVEAGSLDLRHNLPGPPAPLLYLGDEALSGTEIATGGPQSLTVFSAELTGALLPRGPKTEYKFEYGTSPEYGQEVPVSPEEIGPGAPFTRVAEAIDDLSPATTYHYRLVATNESGTFEGSDETFTTPSLLFSLPATDVTESAATLQGSLFLPALPEGVSATYHFEYGLTTDYGHSIAGEVVADEETEWLFGQHEHVAAELDELKAGSTYHYRLVATTSLGVFHGKDQRLRTTKWQASEEAPEAFPGPLQGVSCVSEDACLAVGGSYSGFWDGSEWTIDSGESGNVLVDVKCASKASCMAVGRQGTFSTPLAMLWDGESWVETPTPTPPKAELSSLGGISCVSASSCIAIGGYSYFSGSAIQFEYLAMQWDGEDWQELSMPKGTNGTFSGLGDVSCVSGSFCVAVGTRTMHWDGEDWSPVPMPGGEYGGVSCLSAVDCFAVGAGGTGNWEEGTAARWDGSKWSRMPVGRVGVIGGVSELSDLSCSSPSSCVAVGTSWLGEYDYPLAMKWDGTQWSTEMNSAGLLAKSHRRPYGVSCATAGHCIAVGASWEAGEDAEVLTYDYPVSPPVASTGNASGIEKTAATLNGAVDGGSLPTNYYFEYDTTKYKPGEEPHGIKTPVPPKYLGTTSSEIGVSAQIEGLESGTTYHFRVVATNEEGTTYGQDGEFRTVGKPAASTDPASGIGPGKAELKATVNPSGVSTTYQFEYGKTTSYGQKKPEVPKGIGSGTSAVEATEQLQGLTPTTTYHFRVVATNEEGTTYGQDREFTTLPSDKPTAVTDAAGGIGIGSAHLKATVNPNGLSTTYKFEYGKTTSYGTSTSSQGIGSTAWDYELSRSIASLEPSTTYHFRVVATNSKGTTYGSDREFTTLPPAKPTIGTPSAAILTSSSASLRAMVNPNGASTTYQFEYGKTTSYGSKAPASPKVIGSGVTDVEAKESIEGLEAGETYHFRIVATNEKGTTNGQDRTFTVSAIPKLTSGTEFKPEDETPESNPFIPTGVAVDPEEDVWISDDTRMRAQKFDPEGEYLITVGSEASDNTELTRGIATDPEGNVLLGQPDLGVVQKFDPEGEHLAEIGEGWGEGNGEFQGVQGIATDPEGDVWVVDADGYRVQQFDPEGEYLSQIDTGSLNGRIYDVDVDSQGDIWVRGGLQGVLEFDSEGELLNQIDVGGLGFALDVDATGVIWATVGCKVLAFGTEGEQLLEHGSCGTTALDKFGDWLGLTVDADGNVWVADAPNRRVVKWARAFPPVSTTQAAIEVGADRAILKGLVNPNGASTTYQFEYGKTTSYGSKAPASPKAIGSGTSNVEVQKLIEGLEPGTTYHYRVVAASAGGTAHGEDKTFTTPAEEAGVWLAGEGSEVEAEQPRFELDDYELKYLGGWDPEIAIDLGQVECYNAYISAFQQPGAASSLLFPLVFQQCVGGKSPVYDKGSCEFSLSAQNAGPPYTGTFGVACGEEGDELVLKVKQGSSVVCEALLGEQQVEGVDLHNVGAATERKVEVQADVDGLEYELKGPCVEKPEIRTDGTLSGEMLLETTEE